MLLGNSKQILYPSSFGISILRIDAKLYFPEDSTLSEYLFHVLTRSDSLNISFGSSSRFITDSFTLSSWFFIVFILFRDNPELPLILISNFCLFCLIRVGSSVEIIFFGIEFLKYS